VFGLRHEKTGVATSNEGAAGDLVLGGKADLSRLDLNLSRGAWGDPGDPNSPRWGGGKRGRVGRCYLETKIRINRDIAKYDHDSLPKKKVEKPTGSMGGVLNK